MEKLEDTFSWSRFYAYRKQVRKAHPSVYGLKIKKKLLDVILPELGNTPKILDVGASNKSLGEKILARVPSASYKTMDIDRAQPHDYYSLEEITESFDMIILGEVIEHLEFLEGLSMLRELLELLNPGGKLVLTTPNLFHPNRYWDSDHKTPYRYDEISGALLSVGFTVDKIYRIYNDPFFRRLFRIYLAAPLHRYLDVDFAKSIAIVAGKK